MFRFDRVNEYEWTRYQDIMQIGCCFVYVKRFVTIARHLDRVIDGNAKFVVLGLGSEFWV